MIARAAQFALEELVHATSGVLTSSVLVPDAAGVAAAGVGGVARSGVAGVATDTRDELAGYLFVALRGANFDAHDFLEAALEKGAAALLVEESAYRARAPSLKREVPVVEVEDTLYALGDLGRIHRRRFGCPVYALTGSNGKTTTKEMLAAILGVEGPVLKTEGNLNNLIGVPMTLLGLTSHHLCAVVEMGMNQMGEVARYTEIAEPDVGLILNVGPAHIGMLGSLRAIAEAKGELYAGLDRDRSIAVVNLDDAEVARVAREHGPRHTRTFGTTREADVCLVRSERVDDEHQQLELSVDGRTLEILLPFAGAHNALNAAAACAAATARPDGATLDQVKLGLEQAKGIHGRLRFEKKGPYIVVDDSYNANPASMRAAIETVAARVARTGGRFMAVLGEMRELGPFSREEHDKIGTLVAEAGAFAVLAFGEEAAPIAAAAHRAGVSCRHEANDEEAAWRWLSEQLRPSDVILFKGSRGIRVERFIKRLVEESA